MEALSILQDVTVIFNYLPGGAPGMLLGLFGILTAAFLGYGVFQRIAGKFKSQSKPPPPPAPTQDTPPKPGEAKPAQAEDEKPKRGWWMFGKTSQARRNIRRISVPLLRQSFKQNLEQLKQHVSGRNYLYQIPWFMMIGETGSGKSTLLANTELPQPFGQPPAYGDPAQPKGCDWWFFNDGIVLDVTGDCVLYADSENPQTYLDDDRGWKAFLQLLLRHRPRRPIDGVILAIPADDLLSGAKLQPEQLRQKAEVLYQKIWLAQKTLGMRFPLYVLITKCDQIQGFSSFCKLLPERLQQDIFGWSNPYSLETLYNNNILEQAFQKTYRDLNELQTELVTALAHIPENDSFLLFPHELRPVFNQLKLYLEQIFKPSVYHEPLFFRGLYFCGDGGPKATAEPVIGEQSFHPSDSLQFSADPNVTKVTHRPIFTNHLFQRKLFQEESLARPVEKIFKTRNSLLYATQGAIAITAIAGIAAHWVVFNQLKHEKDSLLPALQHMQENEAKLRELKNNIKFDKTYFAELNRLQRESAEQLLLGIAAIESDGLASVWIPSSWFSSVDMKILSALRQGYENFVLRWFYNGLHLRVRELVYKELPSNSGSGDAIAETAEFMTLKNYVEELRDLQKYIEIYNKINETSNRAEDTEKLAAYLYQLELPPAFHEKKKYLDYIKSTTNSIELKYTEFVLNQYANPANLRLDKLSQALFEQIYGNNPILVKIREVHESLEQLASAGKHSEWSDMLNQINDNIEIIQNHLQRSELAWSIKPEFDLGEDFTLLTDSIKDSALFGETAHDKVREQATNGFTELRANLQSYSSDLVGGSLMVPKSALKKKKKDESESSGEEEELALSPEVAKVKEVLTDFLGQDFMAEVADPKPLQTDFPPNQRLAWNPPKLQEAINLTQSFQKFTGDKLRKFPQALQDVAVQAGHFQLHANLADRIAQAQEFQARENLMGTDFEKSLRVETENFAETGPMLNSLLESLKQLKESQSYAELFSNTHLDIQKLTTTQAHRLLAQINRLLEEDDLFRPADVAYFSPDYRGQAVSLVAFGAKDKEELYYYLSVQRDRVHFLAQNYAKPVLTFLGEKDLPPEFASSDVIPRWTRIYTELFKYDSEKPDNTLTTLENFILFGMDKITATNCFSQLQSSGMDQPSGDYFLEKKQALMQALFAKCQTGDTYLAENKIQGQQLQITLPLDRALFWDVDLLQEAVKEAELFARFVKEEMPQLAPEQQAAAKDAGYANFHTKIIDMVARAQVFDSHLWDRGSNLEEGLQGEIQNFSEAAPRLEWFIKFLEMLSKTDNKHPDLFARSRDQLEQLGVVQARHLLVYTSQLLDADNLYAPKLTELGNWDGRSRLSLLFYSLGDSEELTHYLGVQRNRARVLSKDYAAPLLSFIGDKPLPTEFASDPAIPRWTRIYTELFKYDNAKPENTLTTLESYIGVELDKITPANCYSQLYAAGMNNETGDYFLQKRHQLMQLLVDKCRPSDDHKSLRTHIALGEALLWDTAQLQKALAMAKGFGEFVQKELPNLTVAQQGVAKDKGHQEFHKNIIDQLARAQVFEQRAQLPVKSMEESMSREAQNFAGAVPALEWFIAFFDMLAKADNSQQEAFKRTARDIEKLALTQAYRMLAMTDKLMQEDELYIPNDANIANWDGLQKLSFVAFGASDRDELKFYLNNQRGRIHHLALTYAKTPLAFIGDRQLPPEFGKTDVVPRWTRIYTELFKYDALKPGNTVSYLEDFVLHGMDKITLTNCFTELYTNRFGQTNGDYFLQKRANLQYRLLQQCQYLADMEAYRRYHLVEDFFNQKLAGRFPFADISQDRFFSEADPQDVQDFFIIYNSYGRSLQEYLANSRSFGTSRDRALQFLDKIERVQLFLDSFLNQPLPSQKPLYDFVVDFRVNQGHEVGGNQIIDWALEKTSPGLNRYDSKRPIAASRPQITGDREGSWHFGDRWRFGEAFRFSLRWARNSAYRPFWDGKTQNFTILGNDDTAVFEYRGQWALLEMLRKHQGRPEDFDYLEDNQPHTLKFTIPVRRILPARRLTQAQSVITELPPPKSLPDDCYMDWYEAAYGDKRCLESGYRRVPEAPGSLPEDRMESKLGAEIIHRGEYKLSQQDAPTPSRYQAGQGAELTPESVENYRARYSEEFEDITEARIFMRVNLSFADKKDRLQLPEFPQAAPRLTGASEELKRQIRGMNQRVGQSSLLPALSPPPDRAEALPPANPIEKPEPNPAMKLPEMKKPEAAAPPGAGAASAAEPATPAEAQFAAPARPPAPNPAVAAPEPVTAAAPAAETTPPSLPEREPFPSPARRPQLNPATTAANPVANPAATPSATPTQQ